jgi:hypothetical protein
MDAILAVATAIVLAFLALPFAILWLVHQAATLWVNLLGIALMGVFILMFVSAVCIVADILTWRGV